MFLFLVLLLVTCATVFPLSQEISLTLTSAPSAVCWWPPAQPDSSRWHSHCEPLTEHHLPTTTGSQVHQQKQQQLSRSAD